MAAALALALIPNVSTSAAAGPNALDLRVLLIGGPGGGASDPTTAAWASGLTNQGVAYTEVDATGTAGAETVTLPALTSSANHGLYNGVVLADAPSDFAAGQLATLFAYESTFGVRQVDGYGFPTASLGLTDVSGSALSETATLSAQGLLDFPALAGPVPLDAGTYGYPATVASGLPTGASETPLLTDPSGNVLMGIYQHPSAASDPSDPQAGVQELTIGFDYNATYTQWLLLGPGLIDWVTGGVHLGLYRNYVEMDIDDTFTPDDAWDTTNHTIDYSDADSLRMQPSDVTYAAQWSQANDFRMDQLFNFGSSVVAQEGQLVYAGYNSSATSDPLLAAFQATDPTTGKPYADDFGWISHTYDTPYLDVGCATTDYIEAELNENTSSIAAAPGATPGTGGLGLTETTNTADALGTEDPQVFVPGNHSGFADLVPGNPATVDPPDLDASTIGTGGTLAAGSYQYAVTDQFNSADSTSVDQSAAYLTDPITINAGQSVTLNFQAICHASDYLIYREVAGSNDWYYLGTVSTPQSPNVPDTSTGNPTGDSTTNVSGGGELEQSFTDTGAAGTPVAATTADPTTENAVEQPWEQNPDFIPALEAAGITAVGDDASKVYPDPPTATFGAGTTGPATYTGATYAAGQTFVDGTAQVVPRHPINIYYNNSTEAQAVDEYNTLYDADWPDSQCVNSSTTTCSTTPFTFADIVNQVVSGMLQNMLTNDPEPSYVHQTNIIGSPPGCPTGDAVCNAAPPATAPGTADTTGDGLLYSVLNPLLAEYHSYYNSSTPYEQLTEGAIATTLAEQSNWSAAQPAGTASSANQVVATESGDQVTLTNSGTSSVTVPVTVPAGSTQNGAPFGSAYGGTLSGWVTLAAGASSTISIPLAPSITSGPSATAQVGSSFSFTATATGAPTPTLSESGALPSGITFTNNGDGTATLAGTAAPGTAGSYPITIGAANGTLPDATQAFTLTVDAATSPVTPPPVTPTPPVAPSPPSATTPDQYDLVGSDGGVFVFGQPGSGFYGSLPGLGIHVHNVVGIVPTADDKGYFLVGSDGGVFAFGDAPFENSLPGLGIHVNDIVGIVPTADDKGYFLVGSDGGVFAFGDAGFEKSLPELGVHVNDIVGIAINATGGYWLVGADGSVYALGNALYLGGLAGASATPIDGIAATRTGNGYWLVGQNGSVYTYNAKFYGSLPSLNVAVSNVVGIVPTPDQDGYWLVGSDGGIFAFGDAQEIGSLPGLGIHVANIVGAVPTS